MIGVFLFQEKPTDKNYKFKKDPKAPLKLSGIEFLHTAKITPSVYWYLHWSHDLDKKKDEEIIAESEKWFNGVEFGELKKLRGIENGYSSEKSGLYIKVVKGEKDDFKKVF